MDRKKLRDTFCSVLSDFLNDMYKSYPDASLLVLLQTTQMMSRATPELLISNFMMCVEDYKEKILNRDESFFLEGGLSNKLEGTPYSFLMEEIEKVRSIWNDPKTSSSTKKAIWKYFEILIRFGMKLKN